MGDQSDIQSLLAREYGDPSLLHDPRLDYTPYYAPWATELPPLPDRRGSLSNVYRPDDSILQQNTNALTAASLGRSLAERNWGNAGLDAMSLAMGAIPGAKGGKRGAGGGRGAAGEGAGAGAQARGLPERGGVPGGDRGVPPPGGANNQYVAIPGQPSIVKLPGIGEIEARPIPQVEMAARNYALSMGRPYEAVASFDKHDPELGLRIAHAYEAMKHDPTNPDVRRAYDALANESIGQYRELEKQGLRYYFNKPGEDPYARSPALGYLDLARNGRLSIFPTLEGFGSGNKLTREQIANNPLLEDTGFRWQGQPVTVNDVFRAVHDSFGHHGPGNPFFRAPGEARAFGHHATVYGPEALPAAANELRGQNSWLNYHPSVAEKNRGASGADTIYADQKAGIMPPWTWEEGLGQRGPGPATDDILRRLQEERAGGRARGGRTHHRIRHFGDGGAGGEGGEGGEGEGDGGNGSGEGESFGGEGNDAGMGGPGAAGIGSDYGAEANAASQTGFGMGDTMGAPGLSVSGPDSMDAETAAAVAAALGSTGSFGSFGATGIGPGQAMGTEAESLAAAQGFADAMGFGNTSSPSSYGGFGAAHGIGPGSMSEAETEAAIGNMANAISNATVGPGPAHGPATEAPPNVATIGLGILGRNDAPEPSPTHGSPHGTHGTPSHAANTNNTANEAITNAAIMAAIETQLAEWDRQNPLLRP